MNLQITTALLILILAIGLPLAADASPLSDAREAGLVKELPNGFVAPEGDVPARIDALVADVNKRRRAAYEKIAERNKISVEQVGRESYKKRYPNE